MGIQTPRLEYAPPSVASSGPEAIELYQSTGETLDPWQRYVIRKAMAESLVILPDGRQAPRWSSFEVCLLVARQNGKGTVIEVRELAGLFLLEERLQLHSAHEFKTGIEGFIRIRTIIDNTDWLRRRVKRVVTSHGEEAIELLNGCRLRFVARTGGSGRGFTGDTVYLDEAFNLPGATMAALLPTMNAKTLWGNPQIWYLSSAGWEISHVLASLRKRARKLIVSGMGAAEITPEKLLFMEWSGDEEAFLENPEAFCNDRQVWRQANPGLGIRIAEEGIEASLRAMSFDLGLFAREMLGVGQYPEEDDGWSVVPEADWAACLVPDAKRGKHLVFSLDVRPDRLGASIAVASDGPEGTTVVEVIDQRTGVAWVVPRLQQLIVDHKPAALIVQTRGPAGPLLADIGVMLKKIYRTRILRETNALEEDQACQAFFDAVVHKKDLVHRVDLGLSAALAGAKKKENQEAGTWRWSRKNPTVDLSPLWAVTLARWGWVVTPRRNKPWGYTE